MDLTGSTALSETLQAAQQDGVCAICGNPAATNRSALVPICQRHLTSLDMVTAMGLMPNGYFRGTLPAYVDSAREATP
jgi:hypothetical protein